MGEQFAVVQSYMAHHQGMILLALYNWLNGNRMVHRLHADPLIRSVDLLLQEQPPLNAPTEHPRPQPMETVSRENAPVALDPGGFCGYTLSPAPLSFQWKLHSTDLRFRRWLQPLKSSISPAGGPTPPMMPGAAGDRCGGSHGWPLVVGHALSRVLAAPSQSETVFLPQRVEFERQDGELLLRTTIAVAPEDDAGPARHSHQPWRSAALLP